MTVDRTARMRQRRRTAVIVGLVSFAVIVGLGVLLGKPRLERTLERSTRKSLLDAGTGQLEPKADGTLIRLQGRVRSEAERAVARDAVAKETGVRGVDLSGVVVETTDAATAKPTTLQLSVRVDGDRAYLSGLAPTKQAVRAVVDRVQLAYPGRFENSLSVNGAATEVEIDRYRWFGSFVAYLNTTGSTDLTANVSDGKLRLTGSVPTATTLEMLRIRAASFIGSDTLVVNEVAVRENPVTGTATTLAEATSTTAGSTGSSTVPVPVTEATTVTSVVIDTQAPPVTEAPAVDAASLQAQVDTILSTRQFGFLPSSSVPDANAAAIAAAIRTEIGDAAVRLEVEAYTDSSGAPSGNLRVSQARADAVARLLTEAGVLVDRVSAKGFGEQNPIADNATTEGQALNRRVVVRVLDLATA